MSNTTMTTTEYPWMQGVKPAPSPEKRAEIDARLQAFEAARVSANLFAERLVCAPMSPERLRVQSALAEIVGELAVAGNKDMADYTL